MILKLCFTSVLRSILIIGFLSSIIVSPAFSVESDDSAIFLSGFNAYHKQDYSKAIEDLNELLRKYPQSQVRDMAIFWLARSYFKIGNNHEAARFISQFGREYPENPLRITAEAGLLALMDRNDKGEHLPADEVKGGEQVSQDQAEMDRIASEKAAKEKLAKEQAAREQLIRQQAEKERAAKRQADQERIADEKGDQGELTTHVPLSRQQTEMELLAKLQAEHDRLGVEKAELERLAAEQAAREQQLSRQQAENERVEKLQAEQERRDVEKAVMERLTAKQAGKERVAKMKTEQERLAAEQKKRAAFQSGQPLVATNVEIPQPASLLLPATMVVPLSTPSPDKHDVKHIPASEDHPSYALIAGESSVLAQLDPVVAKLSYAHYQPVITNRRSNTEAYLLAAGCYGDREAALQKRDNPVNRNEQAFVIKNDALYCVALKTFVVENEAKKELDRLEAHGVEGIKIIKSVTFQNSWVLSTGHYSTLRAAVEASQALERIGVAATIVKSNELGE